MSNIRLKLIVTLSILASSVSVYAHHSFAPLYDATETVSLEGRLISFSYRSPHSVVILEAPDEEGNPQRWTIEWGGAGQLGRSGVTRDFFRPGDEVHVTGNPGRNPDANLMVMKTLTRPSDGFEWGTRPDEVVD